MTKICPPSPQRPARSEFRWSYSEHPWAVWRADGKLHSTHVSEASATRALGEVLGFELVTCEEGL
jgi:hypothetical protein